MLKRSDRIHAWTEWDDGRIWNILMILIYILGGCLLFIPILTTVLEDPSMRFLALVVGFGSMALVTLFLTLPKTDRQTWSIMDHEENEIRNASTIIDTSSDSREGMIASLMELKSAMLYRAQKRRRLSVEELRLLVRSPIELHELLDDELLEELILEDPRYLAWSMDRDGGFVDRYEELLRRAEVWT
jgi:hypothetical protein